MAKKRKLRTSDPDPAKPIEPTQEDQETAELHHPQPQPPQQQQPEPTPQDPNAMSLDEPAQEEQHQQQDPEEKEEDEDKEDDLQKPETLEEDQPHTLEAANHNAEVNGTEEEEENEDRTLDEEPVEKLLEPFTKEQLHSLVKQAIEKARMLKELMPGLTTKVFRTFNASITLDDMLNKETKDGDVVEKVLVYQHANKQISGTLQLKETGCSSAHFTQGEGLSLLTKQIPELGEEGLGQEGLNELERLLLREKLFKFGPLRAIEKFCNRYSRSNFATAIAKNKIFATAVARLLRVVATSKNTPINADLSLPGFQQQQTPATVDWHQQWRDMQTYNEAQFAGLNEQISQIPKNSQVGQTSENISNLKHESSQSQWIFAYFRGNPKDPQWISTYQEAT
ncbi:hypothetical protein Fmac_020952 [Flemingia macrophylla]|uniref:DNA topoisomerase I catalytic core eukaryotic-type domain-containing protein n=1 Tax=Flemingia macrophylla TaxID=520843 RepID=A0ABD1LVF7_9FABA